VIAARPDERVEVWFEDEARFGQKGTLTTVWAEKGSRPSRDEFRGVPSDASGHGEKLQGSAGFEEHASAPIPASSGLHKHRSRVRRAEHEFAGGPT